MVNIRVLLYFFDKERFLKIFLGFSFFGLILLADFFLIFKIAYLLGEYLSLSLLAAFSGIGLFLFANQISRNIDEIHQQHQQGYSSIPFWKFIGSVPAAVLTLIPGFISTTIGILLLFPYFRIRLGELFTEKFKIDWSEVYEYFYILYK